MPAIAALILAAGGSTRMGRPKQLIEVDGEALVRRAVRAALDAGCAPVIVVTGRDHDAIVSALADTDVVLINNPTWQHGLGTSIKRGIASYHGRLARASADTGGTPVVRENIDALLIHLCDQPLVDATAIKSLIDAWQRSGNPVCVSSWADAIGPPVVVDASLISSLEELPDDSGAKAIWATHPEWIERVPCPAAAVDLDTPADFAAFSVARR